MVEWHYKSLRKPSGGILKSIKRSDKKLASRGGIFSSTTIAKDEKSIHIENVRMPGGKIRQAAKKVFFANVFDQKKAFKAKILTVMENSASRLYTRRNIITKGALIKIEIDGAEKFARITSRPGQSGMINAIIAKEPIKESKPLKKVEKQANISKKAIKEEPKKEEKSDSAQNDQLQKSKPLGK